MQNVLSVLDNVSVYGGDILVDSFSSHAVNAQYVQAKFTLCESNTQGM